MLTILSTHKLFACRTLNPPLLLHHDYLDLAQLHSTATAVIDQHDRQDAS